MDAPAVGANRLFAVGDIAPEAAAASRRRPACRAIGVIALLAAALGMGLGGGFIGARISAPGAPKRPVAAAAEPSADEVRAQTIDLCTRFAAAYAAIPAPQTTSADIIPATNYVSDALRDNVDADPAVRDAVEESLRLMRQQSAALSREQARGAVQPPNGFRAAPANAADDRVWDRCYGYGG